MPAFVVWTSKPISMRNSGSSRFSIHRAGGFAVSRRSCCSTRWPTTGRSRLCFSGDTIIDRAYWGDPALTHIWGGLALSLIDSCSDCELYWFLISQGYRTYRFLPVFFHEFYPNFETPTPAWARNVIDALAGKKFPGVYQRDSGVIRAAAHQYRLRQHIAGLTTERLRDPHVRFFIDQNPLHADGDELCCIAPLTRANFRPAAWRVIGAEPMLKGVVMSWAYCLNSAWMLKCYRELLAFRRATGNVESAQAAILREILHTNRHTDFGRGRGFGSIASPQDFQARVPLSKYDDYRASIVRIGAGEPNVLTRAIPCDCWSRPAVRAAAKNGFPIPTLCGASSNAAWRPGLRTLSRAAGRAPWPGLLVDFAGSGSAGTNRGRNPDWL